MLREAIKEAATIDEAKREAAAALGLPEEKLQFEVQQMPQKKTLGLFGGCPARVRAFIETSPASRAAEYLEEILRGLGVPEPSVEVREEENGCVLRLAGEDIGFVIGRRGETLDALQYLTGLVANRVNNAYYRVTIDIGNYREKRQQSLGGLARKIAGQAARTGRRTSLEPMNPYERRIIHTAVQEIKGATSWSVGTEPNRHVVIGPSEDNPVRSRAPRRPGTRPPHRTDRRPGDRAAAAGVDGDVPRSPRPDHESRPEREEKPEQTARPERPERPVREFIPRSHPLPTADGATPPEKTESETEKNTVLYGRIDL